MTFCFSSEMSDRIAAAAPFLDGFYLKFLTKTDYVGNETLFRGRIWDQ